MLVLSIGGADLNRVGVMHDSVQNRVGDGGFRELAQPQPTGSNCEQKIVDPRL